MRPWKIRKFFGDIVYDLRSRGLLPVVILLLVAMVAVPVLISRGSKGSSTSLQSTAASIKPSPEAETAVVTYHPGGLRNYKQRLNDLTPLDPFHREFAKAAVAAASELNSTVTTTGTTGAGSATSTTTDTVTSTGGSSGGKKKHKKSGNTVTYQVNVLAGDTDSKLTPFNNVASMTALPSQTAPVVVYFGLSGDHKSALFLVSNKVGTLSGPGTCVPAPDDCSLLSLAAGQSEDLFYSQDGKTYRIVVAEIKRFTK